MQRTTPRSSSSAQHAASSSFLLADAASVANVMQSNAVVENAPLLWYSSADQFDAIAPIAHRRAVWAIGNFDGLHLGHRALFARAQARARQQGQDGCVAGVLTFDPHPTRVIAPHRAPPLLLTTEEKLQGIASYGLAAVVVEPFTSAFASLDYEAFVEEFLQKKLQPSGIVVGDNFRFGKKAAGTPEHLIALFAKHGVTVDVVPSVYIDETICSSTNLRGFLQEGDVKRASAMLGHEYRITGPVVTGDQRGRTIGFPTANVESKREILPKNGVYATRITLANGHILPSVTNIGQRPTFDGMGVRVETHIFDFDQDIYGQHVEVSFVERLRDEQRFAGFAALVEQIHKDAKQARDVLQLMPTHGVDMLGIS